MKIHLLDLSHIIPAKQDPDKYCCKLFVAREKDLHDVRRDQDPPNQMKKLSVLLSKYLCYIQYQPIYYQEFQLRSLLHLFS